MSTARSDNFPHGYPSHPPTQPRSTSPSGNSSPIDPSGSATGRSPFSLAPGIPSANSIMSSNSRSGAGSPSHDMGGSSRLFSKRAREIQAQEGVPGLPLNPWGGPPTSGNSTPLRENIPESPTDGFPDFAQLPTPDSHPQTRRARAGTVPSRFSPGGAGANHLNMPIGAPKSARNTPSQSPFNKSPSPGLEPADSAAGSSTLLSRLRAGSMPQRSQFTAMPGTSSPFGPSIFSSWNPTGVGRERGSTLASIASVGSNGPSSPAQSQFSREGGPESDVHMRTLDYLGLAETPQPPRAQLATPYIPSMDWLRQSNRIRSYSVNNKDVHADEYPDDEYDAEGVPVDSQYIASLQDQLAATNAAIRHHNMAVQAFANQASSTRRRARTAGVLDAPGSHLMSSYLPTKSGTVPNPLAQTEIRLSNEQSFEDLPQALAGMSLGRSNSRNAGLLSAEEQGLEGPTSALWLGNIPTSTTTSTLVEMFKPHGPIVSVRVLTHKNCGFVNFERVESAISAKASMNGKEIFPGASPIRINFAKPASPANTPGHDGAYPSPSPDPFAKAQDSAQAVPTAAGVEATPSAAASNVAPTLPPLRDMVSDILDIVQQFGATEDERSRIAKSLQSAIQFTAFIDEIPPVGEPSHARIHDAPKLRDIRKRIDNQSLSQTEIEDIAMGMLDEIAELASDYLGNTVVQKLFEHCSDALRDNMLGPIAPHMAEIGVHKNGTWAAQKIIDVCSTPQQMTQIVEQIRPYTLPLFLDQYGNYVLQGCLKFGAPFDNYIFETMLSRMWQISQGRFGARAMRACLESHHATKDQQRMLAATIALHSVQLATNQNGALLLTWYLDTCTFPQRRTVLAPRLVPHLVHLCTHKVAYLTVLKIINQKAEPEARDTILNALFFTPNDQILEAILTDQNCGATLIFKVLTTPFFDENIRGQVIENVKNVLLRIKAQPNQGYKRLMDEVGLSTRNSGSSREPSAPPESRQRPSSRQANMNGHQAQQGNGGKQHFGNQPTASANQAYDLGYSQQRPDSQDPNMSAFPAFNMGMMYGSNGSMPPAMNMQQMQYQQNMLGRGAPQMGYNFPGVQAGYSPYVNNNNNAPFDSFRPPNMSNGSPVQPPSSGNQQGFAPPPGFGMGMGGQGFGNGGGTPNYGHDQGNSRRGRR